jgi:hypothetical protein
MEQLLMNLVAGAAGGVATGKASPSVDLGTIGNTITGSLVAACLVRLSRFCCPLLRPSVKAATSALAG